ncbi:uncharacterized protein [Antennarius striatus]|uniref:uncharacterized protein isoform X6 n=1 Tax=Antennarius striatus TaxID=241820 RepID=UPI0035B36E48
MSALSRSTSMDFKRPPPSYPQPLTIALFGKSAELKNTIKNNIFKDNTPFVTLPNGLVMAKNESFRIFGLHLFDEDCNFPDQKIIDFMASSYPGPNMFILIIDLENIQKKEIYSEVYKHKTVFGEDLVRHLTVLLPDQNSFESLIHLKEQFTIGWATDKNLAEQCRKSCHGQQAYLFTYTNYSEDVVKRRRASLEKKSVLCSGWNSLSKTALSLDNVLFSKTTITAKEREPGENPRRHGENIQTPHRAGVEPGTTLLCNDSAIHCTAVMPYVPKSQWDIPPKVVENGKAKILWDFSFQTDKQLLANKPDIVVMDKEQKRAVVIDVAIPADANIRKKEHEKIEKYQGLKEQLEQMWKVKVNVVPVVVGALGAVTPKLEEWLQQIPGTTSEASVQKSAVLGTAKILRRTLRLPGLW